MRAGVFTLALSLVGLGGFLLATNLGYLRLVDVLRWWPLILVLLGAEILIRQTWARARGGPATVAWDRAALVLLALICLVLAGGQGLAAVFDQVGWSWVWETGWFPLVRVERSLTASQEVEEGVAAVEIPSGVGRTIQVRGGADRVEVALSLNQPGRTREEAARLAAEWQLKLDRHGDRRFRQGDPT